MNSAAPRMGRWCLTCGSIDVDGLNTGEKCPMCGHSELVVKVRLEDCPGVPDGMICTDPAHHFSRGDHVIEIKE